MSRLYLVHGGEEIASRRALLPAGSVVEAWKDRLTPGLFWMGEESKALLDSGDLAGAAEWARKGLASSPDPRIAPLGHYVLADVFNRQGREADARRATAAAERLQRGSK